LPPLSVVGKDKVITDKLKTALALIDVRVPDHFIVAKSGHVRCSLRYRGLEICRHPVTYPGFRNKINQVRVTGRLCFKSGLRIRRRSHPRGTSLSVTPPTLVPHGLRTTGYGATAKIRGGWGGFQHASFPVFREPKRRPIPAGALGNWISGKLKTVIISGCH
jgi:hypothetical protein